MVLLFFVVTLICILTNPEEALHLAENGLSLWFHRMIPTLLPFMILSGTMVRSKTCEKLAKLLRPVLYPLFRVSDSCLYAILIGMLCGFPMGARTVADLMENRQLTNGEGNFLLTFVNQIGPIYFCGYVLPLLSLKPVWPYLIGMYAIPLLYGALLRRTLYRKLPNRAVKADTEKMSLPEALEQSVNSAVTNILNLGGYMIFFQLFLLLPTLLVPKLLPVLAPLIEINSGLHTLGRLCPIYSLITVVLGGACCLLQTYSCIRETPCSLQNYLLHKLILTILTAVYYLFLPFL